MKILTNDGIYVQKNDIAYLAHSDIVIPVSIFTAVFSISGPTIIDDTNRYEFVKITAKEDVELLNSLDWIVDYHKVKDLSLEQLEKMFNEIVTKINNLADKYNAMPIEEKTKNANIVDECTNLKFKLYNIEDICLLKRGKLDIPLPEGVENPTMEIQEQVQEDVSTNEKKGTGFQKIIQRIFKKKLD